MSDLNVISINPSQTTLGSLQPEVAERLLRVRKAGVATKRTGGSKGFLDFVWGVNPSSTRRVSGKMFAVRAMMGAYFVVISVMNFTGVAELGNCVMFALGVSMILGFFQRLVSFGGACWFGYFAVKAALVGVVDNMDIMLSLCCMAMSILGPARYSVDMLMRNVWRKSLKKRRINKEQKARTRRMSYKAMHYAAL